MNTYLIVGLDSDAIDFSGPNVPPGMTAERLSAQIEETRRQFAEQGDRADVCAVKFDGAAERQVSDQLSRMKYDCIMIGGGIRQPDESIELFEKVINAIHQHAPDAAIAFLKLPKDGVAAAARVLSGDFKRAGLLSPSSPVV